MFGRVLALARGSRCDDRVASLGAGVLGGARLFTLAWGASFGEAREVHSVIYAPTGPSRGAAWGASQKLELRVAGRAGQMGARVASAPDGGELLHRNVPR